MKIGLGQNQFFNGEGKPLSNGRISIYALGTDTLIPTYYVSGSSFVAGENPIVCTNDGRIDSVFFDAALVDVKVEEYHQDGTYAQIDTFEAGFKWESTKGVVDTIDQLREIDPAQSPVRVRGYYELGDSPERTYIWSEGVSLIDDGGYNINSHISGSGAWVMLWNGETIPASLYGVMAVGISESSKITNIGKWSSLGQIVYSGDFQQVRPPIFEFDKSGFYKLGNRTIYFDGWVRTAYNCDLSDTAYYPTVHCCGIRSEFVSYAKWLFDRNYGATSPVVRDDYNETVSTKWFVGSGHDDFMACAGCERVKFVNIFSGNVYDALTSTDAISGKVIFDHAGELSLPVYDYAGSIVIYTKNGNVYDGGSSRAKSIVGENGITSLGFITSLGAISAGTYVSSHELKLEGSDAEINIGNAGSKILKTPTSSTIDLGGSAYGDYEDGDLLIIANSNAVPMTISHIGPQDSGSITLQVGHLALAIKISDHWYING